jgi:ATP-dependent Lon protease
MECQHWQPGNPLGNGLLPIEVLARPGKGRVTVKGHLDKLIRDHAAVAVEYLRSHSAEALHTALTKDPAKGHSRVS